MYGPDLDSPTPSDQPASSAQPSNMQRDTRGTPLRFNIKNDRDAQSVQTYDLEWQMVRAYWGNTVIEGLWGVKPWTSKETGRWLLKLLAEYIHRGFTPIMEQRSILRTWDLSSIGSPPPVIQASAPLKCRSRFYTDEDNTQEMTLTAYQILEEGRSQQVAEELEPAERIEVARRCYRVNNLLASTKIAKRSDSLVPLCERVEDWSTKLYRSTMAHVAYRDVFPRDDHSLMQHFEKQKEQVRLLQTDASTRDPIDYGFSDRLTLTVKWLPYYLGIFAGMNGILGLASIRASLKHREHVARSRTVNYDDPDKRVAFKWFLHNTLDEVQPLRQTYNVLERVEDMDTSVGSIDLDDD